MMHRKNCNCDECREPYFVNDIKNKIIPAMLDLGGGSSKGNGWTTVDLNSKADVVWDLNDFPYPFADNSISDIRIFHALEHLDNPLKVMEDAFRILKPNGIIEIAVPWWKLDMFTNPYHKHYFKPEWFYALNPDSLAAEKEMIGNCKVNFFVIRIKMIYGRLRFWKKYQYRVWLKAVKVL